MAWMSEEKISVEYVTPTQLLGNNSDNLPLEINEECSEDEDVLLVDFDIDEENDVQFKDIKSYRTGLSHFRIVSVVFVNIS